MAYYYPINHHENPVLPPRKHHQFGSLHDDYYYRDISPSRYDIHHHHDNGYGVNHGNKEGHITSYDHNHELAKENLKQIMHRMNYKAATREEDHQKDQVMTIDAEEAQRRYGGDYVKEYVGPIDSMEAARKYHGVIVPY